MIKTNKSMLDILNKSNPSFSEITRIIWPEFIEVNGCVLIKNQDEAVQLDMEHILRKFGDKTGFEAFASHVHMTDVSKEFDDNPVAGLRFALKLLEIWEYRLRLYFPTYQFYLILTFDGEDTILSFHKIRENEIWLDLEKLDDYETAVLVKKV